jgi:hypothetical protein
MCLSLGREDFNELFGNVEEFIKQKEVSRGARGAGGCI